jgi:hypothetical protein
MARISPLPAAATIAATASLALIAAALIAGTAAPTRAQQQPLTQSSPLATEPLPSQGGGQVATGAAVTGSSPGPGPAGTATDGPPAPSRIDNSQAQQGKLLKPGEKADDMKAASGASSKPASAQPPK